MNPAGLVDDQSSRWRVDNNLGRRHDGRIRENDG
jgi:hypothetical protein